MRYFSPDLTQAEIKDEYRSLCKLHHPDLAGQASTARMQEINAQYALAMNNAVRRERPNWTEEQYTTAADVNERVRAAVQAIIHLQNAVIEICGLWVWVAFKIKPDQITRQLLKTNSYKWAAKKKKWYFAGVEANGRGQSMAFIRSRYGSQRVQTQPTQDDTKKKEIS